MESSHYSETTSSTSEIPSPSELPVISDPMSLSRSSLSISDLNSRLSSLSSLLGIYSGSSTSSSGTSDLNKFFSTKPTPKVPSTALRGNNLVICTSSDLDLQEPPFCFSPARRAARKCLRVLLTLPAIHVETKEIGTSTAESPVSTSLIPN